MCGKYRRWQNSGLDPAYGHDRQCNRQRTLANTGNILHCQNSFGCHKLSLPLCTVADKIYFTHLILHSANQIHCLSHLIHHLVFEQHGDISVCAHGFEHHRSKPMQYKISAEQKLPLFFHRNTLFSTRRFTQHLFCIRISSIDIHFLSRPSVSYHTLCRTTSFSTSKK